MLTENNLTNGHRTPSGLTLTQGKPQPSYYSGGSIDINHTRPRNRVLAALPDDLWQRLAPQMGHILLVQGRTLLESGAPVERVYFPNGGLLSLMAIAQNKTRIETGIVGSEGAVSLFEALNGMPSSTRVVANVAGTATWLPAALLRTEFRRGGYFQEWALRQLQWQNAQATQCALCNRLHTVEERLARWLLSARDILEKNEIAVTHDSIAHMIGTRRSSVTVSLGNFAEVGGVSCHRGRIEVVDANVLHKASCECYSALRHISNSLRMD